MIYLAAALAVCLVVVVGLFVWLLLHVLDGQREDSRVAQTERDDARKALLVVAEQAERERQVLLERIQRPEQVPTAGAPDPSDVPLHVPLDDDEGQWDEIRTEAQVAARNGGG